MAFRLTPDSQRRVADAFEFAMAMSILKDIEKEKNQNDESLFTDEDDEEDEYSEENDEDFDDWL